LGFPVDLSLANSFSTYSQKPCNALFSFLTIPSAFFCFGVNFGSGN
jgi:hypothetical protein